MPEVRCGSLLVAMPMLTDPNFARTIVYVLEHSPDGTVGVVLNRVSDVELATLLPQWAGVPPWPQRVHVGGPCETDTALCLALADRSAALAAADGVSLRAVDRPVHLVDLDGDPLLTGAAVQGLRVFAGYAGWGPGQLGRELAEGAWFVARSRPEDVLGDMSTEEGVGMWRAVLRRQQGEVAMLSTAVTEPRHN